tara:strand:- start:118 stop:981 length:864 start_codon:yes stop_codon:yes gene_type:complete
LKILVTGAGTLLGSSLSQKILANNFNLIASYRKTFPKNLNIDKSKVLKLDLSKKIKLSKKIDTLIHCASAIPSYKISDKQMMDTNYFGFKRLLSQVIKNNCRKVILISTMSVYGKINVKNITEKTKTKPSDAYGKSKLMMEKLLIKESKKNKLNFFILRLPALVGYKSDYNFISKVLQKVKKNQIVNYCNPDLRFNNFIHVENLNEIILKMLFKNEKKILNIGSSKPIKLFKIINDIYKFEKKKPMISIFKSNNQGFNIKLSNYLLKNFKVYSTSKTLKKFLEDNKK